MEMSQDVKYESVAGSDRSKLINEESLLQSNTSITNGGNNSADTKSILKADKTFSSGNTKNLKDESPRVVLNLPVNAKDNESRNLGSQDHIEVALISPKDAQEALNSDSSLASTSSSVDDPLKPPISKYRDYSLLLCLINPIFALVGLCMLSEADRAYKNGDPKAASKNFHSAKAAIKWGIAFTLFAMLLPGVVFLIYFVVGS